jgi:hypothetical protein
MSHANLLVLLVGLGMIGLSIGVIVLAIRELRREGRERRRLYRRRGPDDSSKPGPAAEPGRRSAPARR